LEPQKDLIPTLEEEQITHVQMIAITFTSCMSVEILQYLVNAHGVKKK